MAIEEDVSYVALMQAAVDASDGGYVSSVPPTWSADIEVALGKINSAKARTDENLVELRGLYEAFIDELEAEENRRDAEGLEPEMVL